MKEVYFIPDILTVSFNEEQNYILLNWQSFRISLGEIKKMHKEILTYARKINCKCFIVDTSKTTSILSDEIIAWWRNEWIDILINADIKRIITVMPENILAQQATFDWQKGQYKTIKLYNTTSLDRAERINQEQNYIDP